jgi:hypothetical protein
MYNGSWWGWRTIILLCRIVGNQADIKFCMVVRNLMGIGLCRTMGNQLCIGFYAIVGNPLGPKLHKQVGILMKKLDNLGSYMKV